METDETYHIRDERNEERKVQKKGETYIFGNGAYNEEWSFVALVNRARRRSLPKWAAQLPHIVQRIEELFEQERQGGGDPYVAYSCHNGQLMRRDLVAGTMVSLPIDELKTRMVAGTLPRAFASKRAIDILRGIRP